MDMNKQEAYKIVFDDLMFSGPMTFRGIFDAVNGNKEFMYGICTVIEYIANNSSEEDYKKYNSTFIHNMIASQDGGCFK